MTTNQSPNNDSTPHAEGYEIGFRDLATGEYKMFCTTAANPDEADENFFAEYDWRTVRRERMTNATRNIRIF